MKGFILEHVILTLERKRGAALPDAGMKVTMM